MKKYNVTRMFDDGVERKRTLYEVAKEIESDNPRTVVEVISKETGYVWNGYAGAFRFSLTDSYLKQCVQAIESDKYGVTITVR